MYDLTTKAVVRAMAPPTIALATIPSTNEALAASMSSRPAMFPSASISPPIRIAAGNDSSGTEPRCYKPSGIDMLLW